MFGFSLLYTYMYIIFHEFTMIFELSILSVFSYELTLSFIIDKVSVLFGIIVTFISSMVFMFSSVYMSEDKYYYRFSWILLSFVVSMCILIFSGSLLVVLIGWDGLGVTSFALIIYYQSKESLISGYQTFLINRFGDVLIIISFVYFLVMGYFNYSYSLQGFYGIFLLVLASLTKSAQYPFSSWLPAAMAAPTPVSALVHSSTLVTAGIYLVIRLNMMIPASENFKSFLMLVGSITCFLGGSAALLEYDLKKIIALSTLSQLGLMVFTLGMGFPNLALFHLFTHALFKALLFLAAGNFLIATFGVQDIRYMGSISNSLPMSSVILNICSVCLMGLPFVSAFYSKHTILDKMLMSNIMLVSFILMMIACLFTIMYTTRLLKSLLWNKLSVLSLIYKNNNIYVYFPMIFLGVLAILSGKIFLIENWFLEYSLSPSNVFNYMIFFGIFIVVLLNFNINYYMFSSLFFMTPLYNFSGKILNPILKKMNILDYGWFELKPYVFLWSSYSLHLLFTWPKFYSSFLRVMLLILFIYMYKFF
uniref:NADH-ubiquinone oxidoreductase chain 5 n=1 Tax=Planorbis carinatus TaxID=446412 RepID=A0A7D7A9A6_9GAST|nr:NADH dehydrogenase subunit 5 [Planorbis carinatus]